MMGLQREEWREVPVAEERGCRGMTPGIFRVSNGGCGEGGDVCSVQSADSPLCCHMSRDRDAHSGIGIRAEAHCARALDAVTLHFPLSVWW